MNNRELMTLENRLLFAARKVFAEFFDDRPTSRWFPVLRRAAAEWLDALPDDTRARVDTDRIDSGF